MCGIVGFTGHKKVSADLLMEGLKRLGTAAMTPRYRVSGRSKLRVRKRPARSTTCGPSCPRDSRSSRPRAHALGHHGAPTDANAHPHTDASGDVVVVHNGIIDNFAELKADLIARRTQVQLRD